MSYDLDFWKYKKGVYLDNQDTYEKCSNENVIEGLENLPIQSIIKDILEEFNDWQKAEGVLDFENTQGKGAFQIVTTKQFVRFDCYGMQGKDMNRIIDVMIKYDCPLYDPQVPKRYDEY